MFLCGFRKFCCRKSSSYRKRFATCINMVNMLKYRTRIQGRNNAVYHHKELQLLVARDGRELPHDAERVCDTHIGIIMHFR